MNMEREVEVNIFLLCHHINTLVWKANFLKRTSATAVPQGEGSHSVVHWILWTEGVCTIGVDSQ